MLGCPKRRSHWPQVEERVGEIARAAYQQFPGILLLPPSFEAREETIAGDAYVRFKFRIWPGQGALLEQMVKSTVVPALKAIDDDYADWMVTVHYRAEPPEGAPDKRLPRPAVLARVESASDDIAGPDERS